MKKSFLIAIPVLALLMGSADAVLNLSNLPNLSAEDRASFAGDEDRSEENKAHVYQAYLGRKDADRDTVKRLLIEAQSFQDEEDKAHIYQAYLERKDADRGTVEGLLIEVQSFQDEYIRTEVYRSYMCWVDADRGTVERLLIEAQGFQVGWNKVNVYVSYLERGDADLAIVAELIAEAQGFQDERYKARVYAGYLRNRYLPDHAAVREALAKLNDGPRLLAKIEEERQAEQKKFCKIKPVKR